MDTFDIYNEINEEEINVEKIMGKIRENIRKQKGADIFPEPNLGGLQQDPLFDSPQCESNLQRELEYVNSNWDIQNKNYFISSHRPVAGKLLVGGRNLVHGEVRRYVDPIIWKQTEFNGSTARLLNDAAGKFSYFNNKIEKLQSEMNSRIEQLRPELENKVGKSELDAKVEQLKFEFGNKIGQLKSEMDNCIKAEVNSIISSMNLDIDNKAWLASILDEKLNEKYKVQKIKASDSGALDINYFKFEEQFRGSREDIKQRQSNFINYFLGCSNVLDIGCGRGEFLELSKEHGFGAKGIDIDDTMIDYCLSKGLNVVKDEAISYLEKLDDKSLDGIFIDQVVEHMEPDYLIKLLRLCFQKLKHGYYIFVETVNPLSLVSFANFYIDMTHKKPIHPYTLKFLLEASGFGELETKFISPVPDYARLKQISSPGNVSPAISSIIEAHNQNIDMLNNILYGAQDYAVIGKK